MCFQDWRIGRLIRSVTRTVTIANASFFTLEANVNRVGILWLASTDGSVSYAYPDGIDPGGGIPLYPAGNIPPFINLAQHGDLSTRSWKIDNPGVVGSVVGWVEFIAPDSLLNLALESLRRDYPGWKG